MAKAKHYNSIRHVQSATARVGYTPPEERRRDDEPVFPGDMPAEQRKEFYRLCAKAQRLADERAGIKRRFVPLKARGPAPEIPRYDPKPVERAPKLRFSRKGIVVQGFGPWARGSKLD